MRKQNPWETVCAPKEVPAAAWLRGGERVDAAAHTELQLKSLKKILIA